MTPRKRSPEPIPQNHIGKGSLQTPCSHVRHPTLAGRGQVEIPQQIRRGRVMLRHATSEMALAVRNRGLKQPGPNTRNYEVATGSPCSQNRGAKQMHSV